AKGKTRREIMLTYADAHGTIDGYPLRHPLDIRCCFTQALTSVTLNCSFALRPRPNVGGGRGVVRDVADGGELSGGVVGVGGLLDGAGGGGLLVDELRQWAAGGFVIGVGDDGLGAPRVHGGADVATVGVPVRGQVVRRGAGAVGAQRAEDVVGVVDRL